jgi:tetrahydromethanopterin:alpha-L-glutamate ligase
MRMLCALRLKMPMARSGKARIAIVTDDSGWHGAQLRRAFRVHGFEAAYVSLVDCRIDLNHSWHGIVMPGFEDRLPEGVFVRGIPAGTLEQVVLRLDILHALREVGVAVYNDARAIERSVDKAMTSFLLNRAGVPTPPAWVCESAAAARSILMRETAAGREVVIKPLFGSQGAGLRRLGRGAEIPPLAEYSQVCYLQSFVDTGPDVWHDWRVLVVGNTAAAAMIRRGRSWISNVAQGARCEPAQLDEALRTLAQEAARAVGADYAGVDIVKDSGGRAYVIEVNSCPAWKGLQSVTGANLARRLADDFVLRRLSRHLEAAG